MVLNGKEHGPKLCGEEAAAEGNGGKQGNSQSPKVLVELVADRLGDFINLTPTGCIVLISASGTRSKTWATVRWRLQGLTKNECYFTTNCSEDTENKSMSAV